MARHVQAVAGLQTPCHSPYKALDFDRKYQNNSEKKKEMVERRRE
jgi:hypothetical protein